MGVVRLCHAVVKWACNVLASFGERSVRSANIGHVEACVGEDEENSTQVQAVSG